jgi:hypothetical protein
MLQATQTPLGAMDPATMRAVFNYLAAERGKPLAPQDADRFELGKGIALLRATPKPKPVEAPKPVSAKSIAQRPSVIRDCALIELARVVTYWNSKTKKTEDAAVFEARTTDNGDDWLSQGASYFDVVRAVRKKFPASRISPNMLRKLVHYVKDAAAAGSGPVDPHLEGFRNVVLPERRPKSNANPKGVNHGRPAKPTKPARAARKRVAAIGGRARNAKAVRRKGGGKHGAKRRAR